MGKPLCAKYPLGPMVNDLNLVLEPNLELGIPVDAGSMDTDILGVKKKDLRLQVTWLATIDPLVGAMTFSWVLSPPMTPTSPRLLL